MSSRSIVVVGLAIAVLSASACTEPIQPSDPKTTITGVVGPVPTPSHSAAITSYSSVPPVPKVGEPVTIAFRLDVADRTPGSIYWGSNFKLVQGQQGTMTLTPRFGGPVAPGTTVTITYTTTTVTQVVVNVLYSLQPIAPDTNVVPADGGDLPFFISVQPQQ